MAINVNLLRGKLVEKGVKCDEMASEIGVDPSTFSRKMAKQGDTFSIAQVQKMVLVLQLTEAEANAIFLQQDSQKCEL